MAKQLNQESKELWVSLKGREGGETQLMNDGQMTTRYVLGGGNDDKKILQTRSAFRGFVMALTELMGYELDDTWTEQAFDEDEEGGAE